MLLILFFLGFQISEIELNKSIYHEFPIQYFFSQISWIYFVFLQFCFNLSKQKSEKKINKDGEKKSKIF